MRGRLDRSNLMKATSPKFQVSGFILAISYWLLAISSAQAQQKNLPLNREWGLKIECSLNKLDSLQCTSLKPYIESATMKPGIGRFGTYSYNSSRATSRSLPTYGDFSWFYRKLRRDNLIVVNDTTDKFLLTIDPLFNFEYGKDLADSSNSFYKNTRGILVRGDIGKQFSFETSFLENQATFVDYIKDFNDAYKVIPGQGRWKKFKTTGYDFAMASGYVSYSPSKHFNFQAGHGKHFIGDGYRSLLLSDNAFNYPFARITSTFGKIQYTNLYVSFMNLNYGGVTTPPGTEPLFQKKAGNFQFLSWNVHKRIQLGFFQGLIWKSSDSTNQQCLKLAYASPVIYTAALSEGLKGTNNVILGATLKFKITNSISLYGQYMMDDQKKTGFQVGTKYFDVLGISNLHLQLEYNQADAYSYASTNPSQSYTHYNQPLSHPLGANFSEGIAFLNYRIGDFFTDVKFNYAKTGADHSGLNYGNNIFASDTLYIPSNKNNWERTLRIIDFHLGYLINPSTNLNIFAGISNRSSVSPAENSQTNFVYFGIRTSLNNTYYDF